MMKQLMKYINTLKLHLLKPDMKTLYESILSSTYAGKTGVDTLYRTYGLWPDEVTHNPDGTIDYGANLNLKKSLNGKIPFKFNVVHGNFYCSNCGLTTLEGAPRVIEGSFHCSYNKLRDLKHMPQRIDREIVLYKNELTSLEGLNIKVANDGFDCSHNKLKSLKGSPEICEATFDCSFNELTNLKGGPKEVKGYMYCDCNKLVSLKGAPKCDSFFKCSNNAKEFSEEEVKRDVKFVSGHPIIITVG